MMWRTSIWSTYQCMLNYQTLFGRPPGWPRQRTWDPGRYLYDVPWGVLKRHPWTLKVECRQRLLCRPFSILDVGERYSLRHPDIAFAEFVPQRLNETDDVAPGQDGSCAMRQTYASVAHHFMRWCPAFLESILVPVASVSVQMKTCASTSVQATHLRSNGVAVLNSNVCF